MLPKLTSSTVRWSGSRVRVSPCVLILGRQILFFCQILMEAAGFSPVSHLGFCIFLTLAMFDFKCTSSQWKIMKNRTNTVCQNVSPRVPLQCVTNWATHPTVALMSFITSSTSVRNSLGVSLRCSQLCQNISTGTKTLTDNRLVFRSKELQSEKWPPNTD